MADNDLPLSTLYADGIACGWFVADLLLMAFAPSTMMKVGARHGNACPPESSTLNLLSQYPGNKKRKND